jgi:hypothetical protein
MKVAQYEVLGCVQKKGPSRTGRSKVDTLVKPHAGGSGDKTLLSSLTGRTSLFLRYFPALRTGLGSKKGPSRTGRSKVAFAGEAAYERTRSQDTSFVPDGTDVSFCVISQHFVLGYFLSVPPGRVFFALLCLI